MPLTLSVLKQLGRRVPAAKGAASGASLTDALAIALGRRGGPKTFIAMAEVNRLRTLLKAFPVGSPYDVYVQRECPLLHSVLRRSTLDRWFAGSSPGVTFSDGTRVSGFALHKGDLNPKQYADYVGDPFGNPARPDAVSRYGRQD